MPVVPERDVLRVAGDDLGVLRVDVPVDAVVRVHLPELADHTADHVLVRYGPHLGPELVALPRPAVRVRVEQDGTALRLAARGVRQPGDDDVVRLGAADLHQADLGLVPVDAVGRLGVSDAAGDPGGVVFRRDEVVPHPVPAAVLDDRVVGGDAGLPRPVGREHGLVPELRRVHDQIDAAAVRDEPAVDEELLPPADVYRFVSHRIPPRRTVRPTQHGSMCPRL